MPPDLDVDSVDLPAGNALLEKASAEARVAWVLERFPVRRTAGESVRH